MKFKINDRVRIVKAIVPENEENVGSTGVIISIDNDDYPYMVDFDNEDLICCSWNEEELELTKEIFKNITNISKIDKIEHCRLICECGEVYNGYIPTKCKCKKIFVNEM